MDKKKISTAIKMLLEAIGEDVNREGLKKTPEKVAKMYEKIFSGINCPSESKLKTYYTENYNEIIFIKNISFFSMCEHHLLPFYGYVHIAYIPSKNKIIGFNKLSRIIDTLSKRLQLQERLTTQIANTVTESIFQQGVLVLIEAKHMCMLIKDSKKINSKMITLATTGIFKKQAIKLEALSLINKKSNLED